MPVPYLGQLLGGAHFCAHSSAKENRRHRFLQLYSARRMAGTADRFFMGRFIILRENIPRCKSRATSLASRYTNSTRGGLFKLGQRHRESAHFDLSMSRESCLALPFISRKIRARHLSMMLLPVVCPLYLSSSDPTVQFFLSRKEMGRQRRRLSSSSCRVTN